MMLGFEISQCGHLDIFGKRMSMLTERCTFCIEPNDNWQNSGNRTRVGWHKELAPE